MKSRKRNTGDLIGGTSLFFIGLGVILQSIRLGVGTPVNPQAGFFPLLEGLLITGLSFTLMVLSWRGKGSTAERFGDIRRPALLVAGIFIYVLFLTPVGYLFATIPLTIFVLWILEVRSWAALFFTSIGLSASTYLIFALFLGIELPKGILGFLF